MPWVMMLIAEVNLKRYEFSCSEDRKTFYFESVGPKGVIKKIVAFKRYGNLGSIYYVAFGDVDSESFRVDDSAKSNNADKELIIATVAATVVEFSSTYPDILVYAKGFDRARTRLYQMAIRSHLAEISLMFEIFGSVNGEWQKFVMNTNYEEFFVRRRQL